MQISRDFKVFFLPHLGKATRRVIRISRDGLAAGRSLSIFVLPAFEVIN